MDDLDPPRTRRERAEEWLMIVLAICVGIAVVAFIITRPPPVTSGTITAKTDHPAYTYTYQMAIPHEDCTPVDYGSYESEDCTTWYTYFPITENEPESWSLTLQSCPTPETCRTGEVAVTRAAYDQAEIGTYYGEGQ